MIKSELFKYLPEGAQDDFLAQTKTVLQDKERRADILKFIRLCYEVEIKTRREGMLSIEQWCGEEWFLPKSEVLDNFLYFAQSAWNECQMYNYTSRAYVKCTSSYERFFVVMYALGIVDNACKGQNPEKTLNFFFSLFSDADKEFVAYKEKIKRRERVSELGPTVKPNFKSFYSTEDITELKTDNVNDFIHYCDTLCIPNGISKISCLIFDPSEKRVRIDFVYIESQNKTYTVIDGNIYSGYLPGEKYVLSHWIGDESVIDIPENVYKIDGDAFRHKRNLERINFPSTLTYFSVSFLPFHGCEKLKTASFKAMLLDLKLRDFAYGSVNNLIFYPKEPPLLLREFFSYRRCYDLPKFFVPSESVEAYKNAPTWKRYANIIYDIKDFEQYEKLELSHEERIAKRNEETKEYERTLLNDNKLFVEVCAKFNSEQKERIRKNVSNIMEVFWDASVKFFEPSVEAKLKTLIERANEENLVCVEFLQDNFDVIVYECSLEKLRTAFENSIQKENDLEKRYYKFFWKMCMLFLLSRDIMYEDETEKTLETYIP